MHNFLKLLGLFTPFVWPFIRKTKQKKCFYCNVSVPTTMNYFDIYFFLSKLFDYKILHFKWIRCLNEISLQNIKCVKINSFRYLYWYIICHLFHFFFITFFIYRFIRKFAILWPDFTSSGSTLYLIQHGRLRSCHRFLSFYDFTSDRNKKPFLTFFSRPSRNVICLMDGFHSHYCNRNSFSKHESSENDKYLSTGPDIFELLRLKTVQVSMHLTQGCRMHWLCVLFKWMDTGHNWDPIMSETIKPLHVDMKRPFFNFTPTVACENRLDRSSAELRARGVFIIRFLWSASITQRWKQIKFDLDFFNITDHSGLSLGVLHDSRQWRILRV